MLWGASPATCLRVTQVLGILWPRCIFQSAEFLLEKNDREILGLVELPDIDQLPQKVSPDLSTIGMSPHLISSICGHPSSVAYSVYRQLVEAVMTRSVGECEKAIFVSPCALALAKLYLHCIVCTSKDTADQWIRWVKADLDCLQRCAVHIRRQLASSW